VRESDFIEWIRLQSRFDGGAVLVGPGDDCAIVRAGGRRMLITTDQLLDAVHFIYSRHGPRRSGRKAMARNLSDLAAMAAQPVAAVAAVALPMGLAREEAEAIYRGLREAGDEFGCPLVGGDISAWKGPLAITVTIVGRPAGIEPVLRSGARIGDAICITGSLGGAWRSERHLTFVPRIREARTLAERYSLHSMIDVSDGLARDLEHICRCSGVGAEIHAQAVPIHPDARAAGREIDPLQSALGDGEDYELLLTLNAEDADRLAADQPLEVPVTRIGRIVEGEYVTLIHSDGRRERLRPTGWEHHT